MVADPKWKMDRLVGGFGRNVSPATTVEKEASEKSLGVGKPVLVRVDLTRYPYLVPAVNDSSV